MYWTKLEFGAHKGETLPEIILSDPDYFIWCMDNSIFNKYPNLTDEAESLWRKLRSIKIPNNEDHNLVADYIVSKEGIEIERIILNGADTQRDKTTVHRAGFLDLTFAHYYANEKRSSAKKIMTEIFRIIFGEKKIKLTLSDLDEFLSNEENFGEN